MHISQKRILRLAKQEDIAALGYRALGEKIDVSHPQQVKWHLQKLINDGRLQRNAIGQLKPAEEAVNGAFLSIPILGRANCGEALVINEETETEDLKLSKSLLPPSKKDKVFAVKAVGDSMNNASIDGASIDDGDYVIVDRSVEVPKNGDYVVSSVEGQANIKRFKRDDSNQLIALLSESKNSRPPIVIDSQAAEALRIHGVAIRVIKSGAW